LHELSATLYMKNNIRIGCSSYYNSRWKGVFYPEDMPPKQWFDFYCQHFNTYEINATFYKAPTIRTLTTWYNKAPEGFTYAVKAPKQITHIKKFVDCEEDIMQFYAVCRNGLKDKLGCILFQLPPSFSYTEERLDLILSSLNPEFRNVIEFRNESWWHDDVYAALAKNNITFCTVNYPKLPTNVVDTTQTGYVRLHGNPQLFYSEYSEEELQMLYSDIISQDNLNEVYVYFNNTASSAAIINAQQFERMG
jgi:uncharacterized protein YecE (DUF72 family)